MKMIHMNVPGSPSATLEGYILDCEITLGQFKKRPAIVVCPGGGYVYCSPREAEPVALAYTAKGFHAFILRYSVGWEAGGFKPLQEVSWVIGYLREHAEEWNIDPEKIVTCGFSAGGYIVCLWNTEKVYRAFDLSKPEACFPVYPVTSYRLLDADEWDEGEDKDDFARFGLGCTMQEACSSCFEIPLHVEGFPPSAIFVTEEDELVDPEHSKCLARALDEAGIPCRIEVGPTGGHGFADGVGMCMEGWPKRAIDWYESLK